mmetsp:Transcript_1328/g.2867  ORF Transcript_1328/g.2867 Transcript_1328/m.2867 type:complete len:200 (+) Transcript_1328:628-1227(+)
MYFEPADPPFNSALSSLSISLSNCTSFRMFWILSTTRPRSMSNVYPKPRRFRTRPAEKKRPKNWMQYEKRRKPLNDAFAFREGSLFSSTSELERSSGGDARRSSASTKSRSSSGSFLPLVAMTTTAALRPFGEAGRRRPSREERVVASEATNLATAAPSLVPVGETKAPQTRAAETSESASSGAEKRRILSLLMATVED